MRYATINPATGEKIAEYETQPVAEVMATADRVLAAQQDWGRLAVGDRAPLLLELAEVLRTKRDEYAALITLEMGKTISEARAEVEKCAWLAEVYAENAEAWLAEEAVAADGLKHRVLFEPLGVVLSIMPWNYPFWQALRFAVPGLVAGNGSILKHASNMPRCSAAIEESFRLAGFPPDIFRSVLADHETVAALIASDAIAGVSLTGSTAAGGGVAAQAGRHLKKVVLELGGSDPFIVLDDADVEVSARGALTGRTICAGQSCIAAKRFIVHEAVAEAFTRRFAELMGNLVVGDPNDPATELGPVVNEAALDELVAQIDQSVAQGARLLTGGMRLDRPGFYLAPTVLTDARPGMRVVDEEVFGPVAPVLVVRDEDEAIDRANASSFGLGASVWTRDTERGERLARRIASGVVFVNSIVKSDPRMPFGGVKKSGLGRELSAYGLREFVNIKGLNVYAHGA